MLFVRMYDEDNSMACMCACANMLACDVSLQVHGNETGTTPILRELESNLTGVGVATICYVPSSVYENVCVSDIAVSLDSNVSLIESYTAILSASDMFLIEE